MFLLTENQCIQVLRAISLFVPVQKNLKVNPRLFPFPFLVNDCSWTYH